jgi:hypothetical protein
MKIPDDAKRLWKRFNDQMQHKIMLSVSLPPNIYGRQKPDGALPVYKEKSH